MNSEKGVAEEAQGQRLNNPNEQGEWVQCLGQADLREWVFKGVSQALNETAAELNHDRNSEGASNQPVAPTA